MGILDDAIREHLDLKRRRGADPAEVERAEREALGPVRRNRDMATDAEAGDDIAAQDIAPAPIDGGGDWHEEPATEMWTAEPDEEEWDEPSAEPGALPHRSEDDPWGQDATGDEPPGAAPARGRLQSPGSPDDGAPEPLNRVAPGVGEETAEYRIEQAPAGEHDPDDDVLEETPEFLQDTPDHDRLWFEQRPPRDFDFDG